LCLSLPSPSKPQGAEFNAKRMLELSTDRGPVRFAKKGLPAGSKGTSSRLQPAN